jgi:hypothetical protein
MHVDQKAARGGADSRHRKREAAVCGNGAVTADGRKPPSLTTFKGKTVRPKWEHELYPRRPHAPMHGSTRCVTVAKGGVAAVLRIPTRVSFRSHHPADGYAARRCEYISAMAADLGIVLRFIPPPPHGSAAATGRWRLRRARDVRSSHPLHGRVPEGGHADGQTRFRSVPNPRVGAGIRWGRPRRRGAATPTHGLRKHSCGASLYSDSFACPVVRVPGWGARAPAGPRVHGLLASRLA